MDEHRAELMHAMSIPLHALPDVALNALIVIVIFTVLLSHLVLLLQQEL